ncbi:hypothetical protein BURK1_03173 [Burkholderiales bacterium]|nr:hypothetical protein BURK1_03173 [Burkholderiales bacterium]
MTASTTKRAAMRSDGRRGRGTTRLGREPVRLRLAFPAGAALAILAAASLSAAPLPTTVNTTPMAMTGIGDTIAPPGTSLERLPSVAATAALAFTGIGDTIAPPGASRKALPSLVATDGITMTGTGN